MDVDLRLYALVDPAVCGGRPLADLAACIASSATLVQLRDKYGSTRAMVEEARALRAVLEPKGVPLLINDRVDVALAADHLPHQSGAARVLVRHAVVDGIDVEQGIAGARDPYTQGHELNVAHLARCISSC